jgi:hypothetical protein
MPSYSTGTVSVSDGDTVIVAESGGPIWSGVNVQAGDTIYVDNGLGVEIKDVTLSPATLTLWSPWDQGDKTGAPYIVVQDSTGRLTGMAPAQNVNKLISALNENGFYVAVPPTATEPDPSLGEEDQYAIQAGSGKIWQRVGGAWVFVDALKGFGAMKPWDAVTTFVARDMVSSNGTSYVAIAPNTNQMPPNATFWMVLAAKGDKGDKGDTGNTGAGYGGTSTTSLAIGTGSKALTTQAGLAYTNGARVRASSAANTTNWMEGLATYSGTTLTMTADKVNGSGTHADWNLNVVGQPGAGDLTAANNLLDVANVTTARTNLGAAPSATTISGSGLATGGGDLSANRTITVTAATKADQQTATSAALAVTPLHQQDHPSAAKVWCSRDNATTPGIQQAYNVSSLTDNGVGDTTFNFATAMSANTYSAVATFQTGVSFSVSAATRSFDLVSKTTAGVRFVTGFWQNTAAGGFLDMPLNVAVYGAN